MVLVETAVLYKETETNMTEVEGFINETLITPDQVAPTGRTFGKCEWNVSISQTYIMLIKLSCFTQLHVI